MFEQLSFSYGASVGLINMISAPALFASIGIEYVISKIQKILERIICFCAFSAFSLPRPQGRRLKTSPELSVIHIR
jgi:hypothetical protein